jgi:hypothetical protein
LYDSAVVAETTLPSVYAVGRVNVIVAARGVCAIAGTAASSSATKVNRFT